MSDFQAANTSHEAQYDKWLEATGTEPDNDLEVAALAQEHLDRLLEHGSLTRGAGWTPPASAGAPDFPPEELAAQMALWPRSGQVTPLGRFVPEEEAA